MNQITLPHSTRSLTGKIKVPGDKSISHRAIILGSLAKGRTKVTNFLDGEDCMRTIHAFEALGVSIEHEHTCLTLQSNGFFSLQEPKFPLYFGNSGTTARLMLGVLAGLPFFSAAYGDPYLSERPMDRVIAPLADMGALFNGRKQGSMLPLSVKGGRLNGIEYTLPVKSAQVKSAILLAGLQANGQTIVTEQSITRNHTEQMLQAFGAEISIEGRQISIAGRQELQATDVHVPGDISSGAFFLAAAAIVPGSSITLQDIGLNQTRTGMIDVMLEMGADIQIRNQQLAGGEQFGDITITQANLQATTIEGDIIPRLIDEIPVIALLATQAEGTTIIRDAEELRVKETDRIAAVVDNLRRLGADVSATDDGMIIRGKTVLQGGKLSSYNDHRIAMTNAIASLIATGAVVLDDPSSIAISYPTFFEDLQQIIQY